MRIVLLACCWVVLAGAYAQEGKYNLYITADKPATFFTKKLAYRTTLKDSVHAAQEMLDLFGRLRSQGYFAASIDSSVADSAGLHTYIYVGEKFGQVILQNGNVEEGTLGAAGVKSWVLNNRVTTVERTLWVKEKLLRQCENNGYPFAEVRLDSFTQQQNTFTARVYLERHDLVRIDTLRILGQTKVKRVFLKNYLGIKTGKPYNEQNITSVTRRLRQLQFVEPVQPHTVEFQNGKAAINLYLKDKRASQFDFILGLMPGSSGKKVLITGQAQFHLFSLLGLGEELYLQWQKLQPKTQQLEVRVVYPYLVGLPLGINVKFQLLKQDTSYLNLDGDYGVQYQLGGSNYLKASLRQRTTIILNVDTNYVKSFRTLPPNLDISNNEFALEYFLQNLDYRFNPTSGYQLRAGGSAGVRSIKKNNTILELYDEANGRSFDYLYDRDSIRLKSFTFHVNLAVEKYWRLAARHTIKTSFDGAYYYSPVVFENEKYKLGGVNSLRGFDEQSILTAYYAMANLEYRFILSKNSYFSAFFNSAMVQDTRPGKGPFDFPYGFGVGGALETKVGLFGITYALGTQLDNKLSFKSSKIHFGYVNYF